MRHTIIFWLNLIVFSIASTKCFSVESKWVKLGGIKQGAVFYIDVYSIKRDEKLVSFWSMVNQLKPFNISHTNDPAANVYSSKNFDQIDCLNGTRFTKQAFFYDNKMGTGNIIGQAGDKSISYIIPGSADDLYKDYLCK